MWTATAPRVRQTGRHACRRRSEQERRRVLAGEGSDLVEQLARRPCLEPLRDRAGVIGGLVDKLGCDARFGAVPRHAGQLVGERVQVLHEAVLVLPGLGSELAARFGSQVARLPRGLLRDVLGVVRGNAGDVSAPACLAASAVSAALSFIDVSCADVSCGDTFCADAS